jgi:signal transduction histidine kinase
MKHSRLQGKLIARQCMILLGIGLLFSFSLYAYLRAIMETEVEAKTRLVFSNLLAVQTYVRETLRPAMYEVLPHGDFIIEAMSSSFVTRTVMSDLNRARDQFTYRRVALNPRNPEFAPNGLELELIRHFRDNPRQKSLGQFRSINGEEYYVAAQPVVFDASCMVCHGRPEDAPAVLLARYGSVRGFGRQVDEIDGLDLVTMPVSHEAAAIHRVTMIFILVFACGTILILTLNHFFFDRMMLANIGRLAAILRSRFPAEADKTLGRAPRFGDEIDGMVADMERFADHLHDAQAQLADYAANLEDKVRERTQKVSQEAAARQADVRLFVDMLALFTEGLDRKRLLDQAMQAVAGRFEARAVTFLCFANLNRYVWPPEAGVLELDLEERGLLLSGAGLFEDGRAAVPVKAAESIRGALLLSWDTPRVLPPQEREVLTAVSSQLGIALENLESLENLLRQKTLLESIFEGIADPLFLLEPGGELVHANASAHRLLAGLSADNRDAGLLLGLPELSREARFDENGPYHREIVLPGGRSLSLHAYPLNRQEESGRSIVYARDTSMEKTMLARLQQSEKAMAMGKLAAGLAHEINNPLGVILCYTRLLWNDGKSENAADLDIIIRHTLQARKVLLDLMRFAKPKPATLRALNLSEAVSFIARVFQVRASAQEVDLITDLPPDLPLVRGDDGSVEQVVTNILINSMDALEEVRGSRPGRITVAARHDAKNAEVVLTVSDNGPGISEADLPRVFDPFFSTKEEGKNSGLGLSVAYGLIRDMGGRIEVQSREETVFTVRFRVAGAAEEEEPHAADAHA